jgi:hypothetical protein
MFLTHTQERHSGFCTNWALLRSSNTCRYIANRWSLVPLPS